MRSGSKQRDFIVGFLKDAYTHPDAQEIYLAVKEQFPHVSLGTVYRNLEFLTENKIIKKIQKTGGNDRYDYVRENHNHALCRKCGKIYDFFFALDKAVLQSAVGAQIEIDDADFLVVGVCETCRNARAANNT